MTRKFKSNNSGVVAIEMAFVLPILVFLLFSIFEYSLVFYLTSRIESVANDAARLGMTGNTYGAESREELIENHVKQDLERFVFNFDDQRLNIKVESLDSYSFGGGGGPSLGNNYGSGNQFALYQISYEWPLISPLLDVGLGDNDGDYKITARVIVKNEEF